MRRIWKFKLDFPSCTIELPNGAEAVHVALQNGIPQIWMLVDPDATQVSRRFVIFGTGHTIPDDYQYVDTYQKPPFVWHIFEKLQSLTSKVKTE